MFTTTLWRLTSHDPLHNLAFERYLFSSLGKKEAAVVIWRNSHAVMVGRAQNPWYEANTEFLHSHHIPLFRRISGGGTVYHDLGNLNFTFMASKPYFSRDLPIIIARDALRSLGCDVYADPRRSLFLRHNGSAYKITGSAIRETLTHGLLHGTVLVHADLAVLNEALRAHDPHVHVNGIPSVPSPVTNLPEVTIDAVQATVHEHFAAHMKREGVVMYRTAHADDYAHQLRPHLDTQRSWEWNYGRTPHFSYRDGTVSAEICHGIITDSSVASIVGKRYSPRLMAGPLAPDKRASHKATSTAGLDRAPPTRRPRY